MKKKKNSAPMATMPGEQNNNSVLDKVARAGKWVVVAVGGIVFFLGCEKEPKTPVTPPVVPTNPIELKRQEIHQYYRDSVPQGYKNCFYYTLKNSATAPYVITDTTNWARPAYNGYLTGGPNPEQIRKSDVFVELCDEYEAMTR